MHTFQHVSMFMPKSFSVKRERTEREEMTRAIDAAYKYARAEKNQSAKRFRYPPPPPEIGDRAK